jgi:hypothetical protein
LALMALAWLIVGGVLLFVAVKVFLKGTVNDFRAGSPDGRSITISPDEKGFNHLDGDLYPLRLLYPIAHGHSIQISLPFAIPAIDTI